MPANTPNRSRHKHRPSSKAVPRATCCMRGPTLCFRPDPFETPLSPLSSVCPMLAQRAIERAPSKACSQTTFSAASSRPCVGASAAGEGEVCEQCGVGACASACCGPRGEGGEGGEGGEEGQRGRRGSGRRGGRRERKGRWRRAHAPRPLARGRAGRWCFWWPLAGPASCCGRGRAFHPSDLDRLASCRVDGVGSRALRGRHTTHPSDMSTWPRCDGREWVASRAARSYCVCRVGMCACKVRHGSRTRGGRKLLAFRRAWEPRGTTLASRHTQELAGLASDACGWWVRSHISRSYGALTWSGGIWQGGT